MRGNQWRQSVEAIKWRQSVEDIIIGNRVETISGGNQRPSARSHLLSMREAIS